MSLVTDIRVTVRGDVSNRDKERAELAITKAAEHTGVPITSARVKLIVHEDPAHEAPAIAQASLGMKGEPIRGVAAAATMHEAIRVLQDRLCRQIEHHSDRRLARRHRGAMSDDPSEWRHGDVPTHRPSFFPLPAEQRQIVRHKSYALDPVNAEEAAQEMAALDYDFHLYRDRGTNLDSVVERLKNGFAVRSVDTENVPTLTESAATEWLELTSDPWVFFRDQASDRGAVAYRRYDGHYGVVSPAILDGS